MTEEKEIKAIDIGITRGGAKSSYLANHYTTVQREVAMVSNQSEPLDMRRYRGLIELHIADIANENAQNEMRKILDEKFEGECKELAEKHGYSVEDLPAEYIDSAMMSACACVKGMITLYMDQFVSIEDRYEVLLL